MPRRAEIQAEEWGSFRFLFDGNPQPMWIYDRQGLGFVVVNDAAVELYGYTREEFARMRILDIRPPEEIGALLDHLKNEDRGYSTSGEWRHLTKDGRILDVETTAHDLKLAGREVTLVVVKDITAHKRAEAELLEKERLARNIIEGALDAFIQIDLGGIVQSWNAMAERLFGWTRDEAIGRRLADLIPPMSVAIDASVASGRRFETKAVTPDNRHLTLELSVTGVDRLDGGPIFNIFARDLTERINSEAQLRQAQKMEAVGQLTGGVAHDFNNLLTVILANGEALLEAYGPDAAGGAVGDIISAAERGAQLTRQLLAFSRRQTLNPRRVQVEHLVEGMMRLLSRMLGETIEITLDVQPDLWPVIIDPSQLESSLANLAVNARDAMPRGGRLLVEIANAPLDENYVGLNPEAVAGDYVMLAVSDTGQGMTPEVLNHVFEPFFTTKDVGKGSGLGMSMVFGFVKQSGGHIKIYSEPGHGTTVRLYLPRASSGLSAAPAAARDEQPDLAKPGEVILLVEDDDSVRRMAANTLTRLGYQIIEARDGPDALNLVESGVRIDLLFTDLIMPGGINGIELATSARKLRPDLSVLFTSGYTEPSWADRMRSFEGASILSKPYRGVALARRLRELLNR